MEATTVNRFYIAGIAVRTANDGRAAKDIPALWERFFSEGILNMISNRESDALYCVYTDYESDHMGPYTTILGCRVSGTEGLPADLQVKLIGPGSYALK